MKDHHTLQAEIDFIDETIAELKLKKMEKINQIDEAIANQYGVSLDEYYAMSELNHYPTTEKRQ
jgi:hypothetical protein